MPDIMTTTPPPEISVGDFAAEKNLVRWQMQALLALAGLAITDKRPREALEAALDRALNGRL